MGLVRILLARIQDVSASRRCLIDRAGSRRCSRGSGYPACTAPVLVVTVLAGYIGVASMSSVDVHALAAEELSLVLLAASGGTLLRWRRSTRGAGRADPRTLAAHIPIEVRSYQ